MVFCPKELETSAGGEPTQNCRVEPSPFGPGTPGSDLSVNLGGSGVAAHRRGRNFLYSSSAAAEVPPVQRWTGVQPPSPGPNSSGYTGEPGH